MKRITKGYLSVFFFLLFSLISHAQIQVHYGPRIGLGISSFTGPDAKAVSYPSATIVGLYTHTDFAKKFSLDVELNYMGAGSLFSAQQGTNEQHDYKISMGYISLPVNLNYLIWKQVHLQLGVQTSALLTAVTEEKYQGVITKKKSITDFHSIDVGPTVGCYYQFEKGLQIGIRYYRGIQNIYKENFTIYNTGIQFLVTYQFSRASKEL